MRYNSARNVGLATIYRKKELIQLTGNCGCGTEFRIVEDVTDLEEGEAKRRTQTKHSTGEGCPPPSEPATVLQLAVQQYNYHAEECNNCRFPIRSYRQHIPRCTTGFRIAGPIRDQFEKARVIAQHTRNPAQFENLRIEVPEAVGFSRGVVTVLNQIAEAELEASYTSSTRYAFGRVGCQAEEARFTRVFCIVDKKEQTTPNQSKITPELVVVSDSPVAIPETRNEQDLQAEPEPIDEDRKQASDLDSESDSKISYHPEPKFKLLGPTRYGLTFKFPNRPNLPVLAMIEVKIPILRSVSGGFENTAPAPVGYIIRIHTVRFNSATLKLEKLSREGRYGELSEYHFKSPIITQGQHAIHPEDLTPQLFEPNDKLSYHKAACQAKTILDPTARGKCYCDIDGDFQPFELREAYNHALETRGMNPLSSEDST
ncbi:hypothetical protein BJ508DRAFT_127990 [Ascobolus immersus RN42]|uniref:Uncharacterized protein n=1 Tax=Ascobolus immersus RN42 TaxID=1160509 RepID=A0A3N4I4Y8_ASCIM|nr:hypothetical protein BJ508DRAFT_127990 [Ascobolus immersus RN42]